MMDPKACLLCNQPCLTEDGICPACEQKVEDQLKYDGISLEGFQALADYWDEESRR